VGCVVAPAQAVAMRGQVRSGSGAMPASSHPLVVLRRGEREREVRRGQIAGKGGHLRYAGRVNLGKKESMIE
jgi:hypothetical protein